MCRYYADLEKKRCPDVTTTVSTLNSTADPNACIVWRRFAKYLIFFNYFF